MVKDEIVAHISRTGDIWVKNRWNRETGIVYYDNLCTLKEYADIEDQIALNTAKILNSTRINLKGSIIDDYIKQYEVDYNASLHEQQKKGVHMIVNYSLSVLTGGPGTGKTTTIQCAAYVVRKIKKVSVLFAAPTGKAARRITESTGEKASTIHHLLGLGYNQTQVNEYRDDIVILDEASMIDMELIRCLLNASKAGKKVVLIGDVDQMPSVGPGAVLRDFIASGTIPVVSLTKTFRQKNGELLNNIIKVRNGDKEFEEGNEFSKVIVNKQSIEEINTILINEYINGVKKYGIENTAVLLPYRQSGYCSDYINTLIQNKINPSGLTWKYGKWMFRKNDPVMQLVNRSECVNGEVGIITDVVEQGVNVRYTEKDVFYKRENMAELSLAYAMSITKSQGSEYEFVILCLLNTHQNALNRNIMYTGMSRAKKRCCLITQTEALKTSVENTASDRITLLAEKINAVNKRRINYV